MTGLSLIIGKIQVRIVQYKFWIRNNSQGERLQPSFARLAYGQSNVALGSELHFLASYRLGFKNGQMLHHPSAGPHAICASRIHKACLFI